MCGTQYPNASPWSSGFGLTRAHLDLAPRFGVHFQANTQVSSSRLPDSIKVSRESGKANSVSIINHSHSILWVGVIDGSVLVVADLDVGNRPEHDASCVSGLFGVSQLWGTLSYLPCSFPRWTHILRVLPAHPPVYLKLLLLSPSTHSRKIAVCLHPCAPFQSPGSARPQFPLHIQLLSLWVSLFRILSANLSNSVFQNRSFCSSCPSSCFLIELLERKEKLNVIWTAFLLFLTF